MSALARLGRRETDVAILDPTDELVRSGWRTDAPEQFASAVQTLAGIGSGVSVVSGLDLAAATVNSGRLRIGHAAYGTVVLPGSGRVRPEARTRLEQFIENGGRVVVVGQRSPATTGLGVHIDEHEPGQLVASIGERRIWSDADDLLIVHRELDDGSLYLLVNRAQARSVTVSLARGVTAHLLRPYRDEDTVLGVVPRADHRQLRLELGPDELVALIVPSGGQEAWS